MKPEVTLGDYKGIEVAVAKGEVTDAEVTEELERLQQRHAELVVIDEGSAQNGDVAVIDFDGSVDGVPFEGGQAERYSLELGSNTFIPGFEEQVVGLSTGDFKDVEVTFPESYHAAELAGKQAVFKVKVHEIKRKQLPELDDEFAKDVSEFDTLEEYKADLKTQLESRKADEFKAAQENAVVEKVAENAEVDIPSAMVDSEVQNMMRDFDNRLRNQGMNLEMFLSFSGQTQADLRGQMQDDASKRVRNNLVLEAVGKAENIEVSDEEVNQELEKWLNPTSVLLKRFVAFWRAMVPSTAFAMKLNCAKRSMFSLRTAKLSRLKLQLKKLLQNLTKNKTSCKATSS